MNEQKKSSNVYWVVIVLFVILILILLFFTKFGTIENDFLVPTGNVDVFDININCDCNCSDQTMGPAGDNILGDVFVDDKWGNYVYQQNLNIFTNAAFEYKNKIAPGTANVYQFVVHNSTKYSLRYNITMEEETEYKINLKYRLRKNDSFVVGDDQTWVTADELKTALDNISGYKSDKYSLDWKWAYSDGNDEYDTYIGENMTSVYKLNINIYFELVEA